MYKSIKIITLVLLISNFASAQKLGQAVILECGETPNELQFHNNIIENINTIGIEEIVIYQKNDKDLNFYLTEQHKERPSKLSVFSKQYIYKSDSKKPIIKTKVDTSGKVIDAWIPIWYNVIYYNKLIDIPTGELIEMEQYELPHSFLSQPSQSIKIKYKKYFTGYRGNKKIAKRAASLTSIIAEDYKKEISNLLNQHKKSKLGSVKKLVNKFNAMSKRKIFDVTIDDKSVEKITGVKINGGKDYYLQKNDIIDLYALNEIEGIKTVKHVTFIQVEEAMDNYSNCDKTFIQSRKKWSKRLKMYDKIYALQNESLISELLSLPEDQIFNISLNVKYNNVKNLIKGIFKFPNIRIIERELETELNFLRNMYKDEKFINYNLAKFQDKQLGAKYLLTKESSNLSITEISTGKLIQIDKNTGNRGFFYGGYTNLQAMNLAFMKITNTEIEFVKVLKEKKKKVKKILIYHPFGFKQSESLDISIIKEENINGKIFKRKEFIGLGWITSKEKLHNLGEFRIKKNARKAFYTALQNNEKLHFSYPIKRD